MLVFSNGHLPSQLKKSLDQGHLRFPLGSLEHFKISNFAHFKKHNADKCGNAGQIRQISSKQSLTI